MSTLRTSHPLTLILCLSIFALSPRFAFAASEHSDEAKVEAVVIEMNEAFSKRDVPGILATFEEGAAKVSLFHPHGPKHGPDDSDRKIRHGDLAAEWGAMFGILFQVTKSYERKVRDLKVHVDQDIAVAWASMSSVMVPTDGGEVREKQFSEVITLRRFGDEWKIAAISNNNHD